MSGLSDFFEDLRTSNYVRLWALFWFIGVIVIGVGVSSYGMLYTDLIPNGCETRSLTVIS